MPPEYPLDESSRLMLAHFRDNRLQFGGHTMEGRHWKAAIFRQQHRRCRRRQGKVCEGQTVPDEVLPSVGEPPIGLIEDGARLGQGVPCVRRAELRQTFELASQLLLGEETPREGAKIVASAPGAVMQKSEIEACVRPCVR
jgi:hypothetical protein